MRHILFFIESFSGGGAEKVLLTILRHLNYHRFEVTVLVMNDVGALYCDFHRLPVRIVSVIPIGDGLWAKLKYKLIYRWLPIWLVAKWVVPQLGIDMYVAFVEGVCTKLLASLHRVKKVAWVHSDLIQLPWTLEKGIYQNREKEIKAYKQFDKVICVSHSMERMMCEHYGLEKVCTIYNPIDESDIEKKKELPCTIEVDENVFNIVAIGRLTRPKGFDHLLPIVKKLMQEEVKFKVYILGEGEERKALERQQHELRLDDVVSMPGFIANPYSILKNMQLLVCPSIAEGYSLVIAEALYLGVPVISMDCSGPSELLEKERFGELCSDWEHFYSAIKRAMVEKNYFIDLQQRAVQRKSFFSTLQTVKEIENFAKKYDIIHGIHDIMVHDYGPGRKIVSFHAEIPANSDICKAHDIIDQMEQDIFDEFGCITTIHMDPIVVDNDEINNMRAETEKIVKSVNEKFSIHDFRMTDGGERVNLIFDLVVPIGENIDVENAISKIQEEIHSKNSKYHAVIKAEHSYV